MSSPPFVESIPEGVVVLASAIRGKSVLKGDWDVKEVGKITEGNEESVVR
jgi:hypothetical protein